MIRIDFIEPVSLTAEDGSRYILTIIDYFTKWAEVIATCEKTASSVATGLFKVQLAFAVVIDFNLSITLLNRFSCIGVYRMQVILSDNGREFDNSLDSALADLLGLERRLTTPYHPHAGN